MEKIRDNKKNVIVVLPSYREGLPRQFWKVWQWEDIFEQCPGCRETVKNNGTDFFKAKKHRSLIKGMEKFINNKKLVYLFGKDLDY